ncbi:MAG: site-specific integrase [Acidobacteriota bacterium]
MGKRRTRRPYGTGSIFLRGKKFWIAYYFNGRRVREGGFESKSDAEKVMKMRQGDIYQQRYKLPRQVKISFMEMVEKYFEWAKINRKSWPNDIHLAKHLSGYFSGFKLSQITNFLVEQYKIERKKEIKISPVKKIKKTPSNATINRELALLKRMFNLAIKWELADSNPVKGIRFLKEEPREKILTPEEIKKLLQESNGHLKPIIITALNTGMRLREILYLRWGQVNFQEGFIHITHSKNGKIRRIPMNSMLLETLKNIRRINEYVFIDERNGKPMHSIRRSFENACRRAKIIGFRFHDLRHTFSTYTIQRNCDIISLKEILGHADIRMTSRYSHATMEGLRKTVNSILPVMSEETQEKIDANYPQLEVLENIDFRKSFINNNSAR